MDIATCKKRRGISHASITKLATKLNDLESKADQPTTLDFARRLKERLDSLDLEFKTHHYALVEQIEERTDLDREQETIDNHDDEASVIAVCAQKLIALCSSSPVSDLRKTSSRRLAHINKNLSTISDAIGALAGEDDILLLHQYEEQIADCKKELNDTRNNLLSIDLGEEDELSKLLTRVGKKLFDCSLSIKKSLRTCSHATPTTDNTGVKLLKLEVPTFDGNLLNWRTFWEQFLCSWML